jgi:hypothetical protein
MMWFNQHRHVDRHFAGMGTPARDRRMFEHLRSCARCRDRYRTYSTLETMAAGGEDDARERLKHGIFPPGRRPLLLGAGAGLVAAFAAVVVLVAHPGDGGFRARGGAGAGTGQPSLSIYRVAADGVTRTQRAGSRIRSGEPLAFSFTNPLTTSYSRLMVFAVDGGGHVFWFWPAWTNPADDPASIVISPGAEPMELGESVRHPLTPGRVTIYGLFSAREHHVREIESSLTRLSTLEGHLWSETLDVGP